MSGAPRTQPPGRSLGMTGESAMAALWHLLVWLGIPVVLWFALSGVAGLA